MLNIPNLPKRYFVDINGNVYSKRSKLHKLKQHINGYGYPTVSLFINKKDKQFCVHRLVAQTYILNPENKTDVNHIDGNKLNNNIKNLEWSTRSENTLHQHRTGLVNNNGINSPLSKLTERDIINIRYLKGKEPQHKTGLRYNISQQHVSAIQTYKWWKHLRHDTVTTEDLRTSTDK